MGTCGSSQVGMEAGARGTYGYLEENRKQVMKIENTKEQSNARGERGMQMWDWKTKERDQHKKIN